MKLRYVVSFFICGLILFVSYLTAGIIDVCVNAGISLGDAVSSVVLHPFSDHFNSLTPILMVIGFILFELVYFFKFIYPGFKKNEVDTVKKEEDGDSSSDQIFSGSGVADDGGDSPDGEDSLSGIDISDFGFVIPDNIEDTGFVRDNEDTVDLPVIDMSGSSSSSVTFDSKDDEDMFKTFSSDVFWALSGEYDTDQINEMVKLFKYNKDISPSILKNTFPATMPAEDIKDYIDMFYG